jgi:sulfate transport system permease protein
MKGFGLSRRSAMPGFGLTMGLTLTMLSLIVLLPIGALLLKGASFGLANVWEVVNRPRTWAALFLSFRLSAYAALFNLAFGVLLAWVLVRYRFAGRRLLEAAIDLPFALPTAVAGIALTTLTPRTVTATRPCRSPILSS